MTPTKRSPLIRALAIIASVLATAAGLFFIGLGALIKIVVAAFRLVVAVVGFLLLFDVVVALVDWPPLAGALIEPVHGLEDAALHLAGALAAYLLLEYDRIAGE